MNAAVAGGIGGNNTLETDTHNVHEEGDSCCDPLTLSGHHDNCKNNERAELCHARKPTDAFH